jgi:hypothetical protein
MYMHDLCFSTESAQAAGAACPWAGVAFTLSAVDPLSRLNKAIHDYEALH